MKKLNKKTVKTVGVILKYITLVLTGMVLVTGYQALISHVHQDGVNDFKATKCDKYSDTSKKITWLECDSVREK